MKRTRLTTQVMVLAMALFSGALLRGMTADGQGGSAVTPEQKKARVDRGAYLVTMMGCNDCHTPWKMGAQGPEPDMTRALTGHPQDMVLPPPPPASGPWIWHGAATNTAFAGPWGVSFTANLTPDRKTGLGDWTVQDFKATIRTGRHLGRGRAILPPMPIPVYNNLSDDDLESVFAYLRTIAPIENRVPEPWGPSAK
jgi:mono/diheme cytochrome c family protein